MVFKNDMFNPISPAGRREDAGLIIAKKAEFEAYKARLEAAGYVVLDDLAAPPLTIPAAKSL
jgi:hypothetical protein